MKKLILASGSPRRREIMSMAGYEYTVIKTDADETADGLAPDVCVRLLSERKAKAALQMTEGVILSADTVVAYQGEILGKPADAADARRMLTLLSGKTHSVFTGITITDGKSTITESVETMVDMRQILGDEMEAYIATGSPLDKAGAYGIQEAAGMFVCAIRGDYYSVMGLPLCRVSEILRDSFGIVPKIK